MNSEHRCTYVYQSDIYGYNIKEDPLQVVFRRKEEAKDFLLESFFVKGKVNYIKVDKILYKYTCSGFDREVYICLTRNLDIMKYLKSRGKAPDKNDPEYRNKYNKYKFKIDSSVRRLFMIMPELFEVLDRSTVKDFALAMVKDVEQNMKDFAEFEPGAKDVQEKARAIQMIEKESQILKAIFNHSPKLKNSAIAMSNSSGMKKIDKVTKLADQALGYVSRKDKTEDKYEPQIVDLTEEEDAVVIDMKDIKIE